MQKIEREKKVESRKRERKKRNEDTERVAVLVQEIRSSGSPNLLLLSFSSSLFSFSLSSLFLSLFTFL